MVSACIRSPPTLKFSRYSARTGGTTGRKTGGWRSVETAANWVRWRSAEEVQRRNSRWQKTNLEDFVSSASSLSTASPASLSPANTSVSSFSVRSTTSPTFLLLPPSPVHFNTSILSFSVSPTSSAVSESPIRKPSKKNLKEVTATPLLSL